MDTHTHTRTAETDIMPPVRNPRPEKIEMEVGWKEIKAGVDQFLDFLNGDRDEPASATANMGLYTKVYNMCTQKSCDCSEKLYARYKKARAMMMMMMISAVFSRPCAPSEGRRSMIDDR